MPTVVEHASDQSVVTEHDIVRIVTLNLITAITRQQALQLYTINGARISFEENQKGSIEAGKLADFLVLSDDLLTVPEDDIKDIEVLRTVVAGKTVFEKP